MATATSAINKLRWCFRVPWLLDPVPMGIAAYRSVGRSAEPQRVPSKYRSPEPVALHGSGYQPGELGRVGVLSLAKLVERSIPQRGQNRVARATTYAQFGHPPSTNVCLPANTAKRIMPDPRAAHQLDREDRTTRSCARAGRHDLGFARITTGNAPIQPRLIELLVLGAASAERHQIGGSNCQLTAPRRSRSARRRAMRPPPAWRATQRLRSAPCRAFVSRARRGHEGVAARIAATQPRLR